MIKMNKVKLFIFDMDGLLLDTERFVWSKCQKMAANEQNIDMPDEVIHSLIGSNAASFKEKMLELYEGKMDIDNYVKRVYELTEYTCVNEKIPLRPGVLEVINFCIENNIKMTVGTSTLKRIASKALEHSGLDKYFDFVVYGDDVKHGKPDPEPYLKCVDHFNLKPEDCMVFEDSPVGSKAAYNGNIPLVYVQDLTEATPLEHEKAFVILHQIDEIIPIVKKLNNIS